MFLLQLLEINKPTREIFPVPIIAFKIPRETQAAFDLLAEKTY